MHLTFISSSIITYIMILLGMAFYTLLERKYLGYFQLRKGPNKIMIMGLPQPFADAIKLFIKEQAKPNMINKTPFFIAPVSALILTLLLWTMYPHNSPSMLMTFGVLYFLCISSLNVYTMFIAGWCSNSKYSLLGALRSIAQTISYEVSMSLILISCLILHHSMNLTNMNMHTYSWMLTIIPPMFFLWFITNLAETNRTPFDLAEGESELVSGFNTEYSSATFALIFMSEYANILFMSMLTSSLFMGLVPFTMSLSIIMTTMLMASVFVWIRASFPRMRYDKLMYLTWKSFLPITLGTLLILIPLNFM